jgi:hypothetical protein
MNSIAYNPLPLSVLGRTSAATLSSSRINLFNSFNRIFMTLIANNYIAIHEQQSFTAILNDHVWILDRRRHE